MHTDHAPSETLRLESRRALRRFRAFATLVSLVLAVAVFGGVVPFALLAAHVVPSHGLANVVYLLIGAALGLVIGGVVAVLTLRGEARLPRAFVVWVVSLALVVVASLAAARWFDTFAHV